jgi:PAS domain S-box-containing protein
LLSENQGLHALARQLVNQPEIMLQNLVDMALDLCTAQSVGVSLLQTTPSGEEVFGWIVLAGTLKQYVGNTAPRNFSPCGTCLDRGTPQLYSYPGRYFTYLQEAEAQIIECLVLPLTADNHALGTIWIVSHDEQRHFDSEDVRVMTSLADFTAAALLLNQRQTRELLAANAALEAEIIERKRSQEALRENDAYLKSLVNLVPDMLWRNDVTGNTSWYNQRWLDYTGQTMEEAQGYGWLEVIDPEDRAQSLANFQNAVNERRLLRQEHRIRGTDGNYRWFLIRAEPVFDARGCIIQWFGTATDIHEQRTVLETLRESEERLQLAADAATFGTYEYIPQTDQINWSTTLKAIHGLPEDAEITFARLSEFIHPDDQEQTLGKFHQFLSPDAPGPYQHEFRIVRTDGAVRWVLDKGQVFFTGEGEHRRVDRAIGVTLDITDRKLSEAALHESEQRLRTLIENLPGGAAFVVDRNLRYLLAEGEALYAAGFKREDLVGKTIFEAMPPELTAKYEELYRMALLGESFEHEHNAHDHSYISRGTPLRTKSGEVYAVLAVSYDISDRKKAEVALRESEERFRLFVTASSDIIYRMSADWSQMRNLEGKNILASTENPSHTWLETYIPKEEQPQVWAVIQEAIRTKSTFELEHRVIEQDGTIGWTFSRAIPMLNEQGEIIEWFGAASDVSDRKQTEAAIAQDLKDTQLLRDLSARLVTEGNIQALYQEIMATAIALTRADAGTVQILDEATQDLVLLATQGFERNMIEHFYRVNASSNTPCGIALVTGERTFVDFDVPENEDPDGSCRVHVEAGYLCAQSTPLIARSGKAIGMFSTHWRKHYRPSDRELRFLDLLARQAADLIEQRQVQVALRESEEKYRTLFNSIDEGFCIFELIEDDEGNAVDWIYLEANPAFEQQTGFINPIGKRISEFQPDLERLWFERFAGVARTGQPMRFVQYTEAMGIWYDVYALRVGVAGDNRVSLLFTDITDRKRREANLAFLAGLMNDFAPLATAKEIMEMAGKRIAEHLDLSRYMFVEIYPEAGTCTYLLPSRPAGQLEISGSYILADYHTEEEHRLLSTGHSMVMNDVRDGTRSPEQIAAFEAFDIASIVNTPYLSNGRWVFDLGVARSKPSVWREDEIELLREISARVWLRIERARIEVDLRQSEEKYRSLFESIDEGYALCEVMYDETGKAIDWQLLEVNPAFERLTGFADAAGKTAAELNPNLGSAWIETFNNVAQTGEPARFEHYIESVDYWFDLHASRLDGDTRHLIIVFNNITDRKRVEANGTLLTGIADDLTRLVTPDEIINAAGGRLGEALNLNLCLFVDVDEERDEVTVHHAWQLQGLPSLKQTFRIADFLTDEFARSQRNRETFIVRDTANDERTDAEAYARLSVGSILAVPFHRRGRWVAYLTVTDSSPRDWRADEIEVVREVAERMFPRIERARAEADLRESEAKYRSLFESMNEGLAISELVRDESGRAVDARYLELNPAYERQTGFDRSSALDRLVSEVFPTYYRTWLEIVERVLRTGQPERLEQFVPDNQKWFAFHVTPFGGADGFTVLYDDITERKRQEQEQAFLLRLSDALRPLADPIDIMAAASEALGRHLDVGRCGYCEVDETCEYYTVFRDWTDGVMPSMVGRHQFGYGDQFREQYRAGKSVVIDDALADARAAGNEAGFEAAGGIRAAIGLPLIKEGRFVAGLFVMQLEPRRWTAEDEALMLDVAERTWAAVERARAEESLRESEIQRVREQSAREQERQRAEALAELDRAKTTFFSNVSHEFRTPLTLLLAPLQDALNDRTAPLAPPHRERLELAHRNTNRLLKLVNTLLDFSRIEAARMEAVYEATDLALLTTELASVFRSAIERAGLRLIVDCPPLPELVYVDREMWEKIVLNLLSNAFKFTFEGEIGVSLHSADDHHVTLQVQDTGTGILPEELPHLMKRFYQIRGAKARTHEASGIGLALVHELIRLHGGTVDVSSTVGQGSCFTVTILLGTAHLPNDRISATRTQASTGIGADPYVQEAERWLPEEGNRERLTGNREQGAEEGGESAEEITPSSPSSPLSPSPRILLVDDNADMRDYLTRILSEHVQVQAVGDGAAALAAAQEQVPDLVLSDVMMPGLDGFELLKALRAEACTREVPIILLSARAGVESVVEGLEAGADDYLIKPFSATELVSRVNAHLQMAHLRLEALRQERTTSRRKDEMLSIVSHELNTPLVAILGWTRLLRANPPSHSMLMKSLETIERNATLQAKLISDLLDISRITAGKLHLNLEPVELQSVIETAIATVHQTQKTKDIELTCLLDPLPIIVQGDLDRLQQIVLNLLTNAIKFTPKGGRIEIRLNVIENQAQIKVSDSGCGISAEFLPHVFDSFRQAESSKSQSIKGLGLGLAIARHLVELHGGTIYAESPGFGQGATFTVNLALISVSF